LLALGRCADAELIVAVSAAEPRPARSVYLGWVKDLLPKEVALA